MDDLISRQAAIDALNEKCLMPVWCKVLVKKMLTDLPPAQPQRKKGKWDTFFSDRYKVHEIGVECSCCGYRTQERTTYCPNCGAEMEKGAYDE